MKTLLNIIWLVFGGLWLAIGYFVAGVICCVLIVTIPWGIASFRIASYTLWPFGRMVVDKPGGNGVFALLGNVIWLLVAGIWIAVGHVVTAIAMALTIIGIPLAIANLKLIPVSLMPLGKQIVPSNAPPQLTGADSAGCRLQFARQVPPCGLQPQPAGAVGVEQRIQIQQVADDGGPSGSEVGVADVRIVFPDGSHIPCVLPGFAAENGKIRVAEEGAAVVPWSGPVIRGHPDQACHLSGFRGGQSGLGKPGFGEPRGLFLVLPRDSVVNGVVEPGGKQHGPGRLGRGREQIQRLQHRQQVGAAVIPAVRFAPAVQKVQEQRFVLRQHSVPALQQWHFQ